MKKILVSVILLFAICMNLFVATSCSNRTNLGEFVIPEEGFDTTTPVTITFYHTMGQNLRDVLDRYILEFQAMYPNITVLHEQVGGYEDVRDQIKTELAVGAQPNIAYCYPDHVALYNMAKGTVALDDLIASTISITREDGTVETLGFTEEQQDDFITGYYEEGKQFGDGKMYTLPFSKSTEVFFYNKIFFEACNKIYSSDIELNLSGNPVYLTDDKGEFILDAEGNKQTKPNPHKGDDTYLISVPTTWDQMEEVLAKIKKINPTSTPLGYDSESNWFITMCEQLGSDYTSAEGEKFIFDNEQNRAFVERFRDWYQKGYVTTQELGGGYTSALFKKKDTDAGKAYMCIGSSAGASNQRPNLTNGKYDFEVDITSVPQVDPTNPKVISQGPSVCIFNKANPQEVLASWLFVKFLTTSTAFQAEFSMVSGYMPVIKSVSEDPVYRDEFLAFADGGANITALSAKVALEQHEAYYTSPAFIGSAEARDQVGLLMQKCLSEKADDVKAMIKKAFEDAVAECKYQAGG